MTSQMIDQSLLPGPLAGTAAPDALGARHCKQPGCGSELPAAAGRGAPQLVLQSCMLTPSGTTITAPP